MPLSLRGRAVAVAGCACAFASSAAVAQPGSVTLIPGAAGGTGTRVYALSADGRAAGGFTTGLNAEPGFLWTAQTGRYDLGLEPGTPAVTQVYALSGDGAAVAGAAGTSSTVRPFRWSGPGTYQDLGLLPGYTSGYGEGISGDGQIVVGRCQAGLGFPSGMAFRWTQGTGLQPLGYTRPDHAGYSEATAISRNGAAIVGYSQSLGTGATDAFVWTQSGGMQILPQVNGAPSLAMYAHGVNFDGSIAVGTSSTLGDAIMWRNGAATDLGRPVGWGVAVGNAVSDDASVVACTLSSGTNFAAGVWTPSRGIEPLATYLAANGVQVPSGWTLRECVAVSADGLTLGGWARADGGGIQGFVVTIPSPGGVGAITAFGMLASVLRRTGGRWTCR